MGRVGYELLLLGPGLLNRAQRPAGEDEIQKEQQPQRPQAHGGEHEGQRAPAVGGASVGEGHHEVGACLMLGEVQSDVGQIPPGRFSADDFGNGVHEQRLGHGGSRAVGQLHDRAVGNIVDRHGQRGLLGGAGASDAGRRETGIAGAGADILGGSGGRAVLCGCFRAFNAFARVCVAARGAFRVVVRVGATGRLVSSAIVVIVRAIGVCGVLAVFPGGLAPMERLGVGDELRFVQGAARGGHEPVAHVVDVGAVVGVADSGERGGQHEGGQRHVQGYELRSQLAQHGGGFVGCALRSPDALRVQPGGEARFRREAHGRLALLGEPVAHRADSLDLRLRPHVPSSSAETRCMPLRCCRWRWMRAPRRG